MPNQDFSQHNQEVRELLKAYEKGENSRIRMSIDSNPRMILMDSRLNKNKVSFQSYLGDPKIMLETQMRFEEFVFCELYYDHLMGLEDNNFFAYVDSQNTDESLWFGAELYLPDGGQPGTRLLDLDDYMENFAGKLLDPFSGIYEKEINHYNYFVKARDEGYEYKGKPLSFILFPGLGTDGPFTLACGLFGPDRICVDMRLEPEAYHELMNFITENTINRIKEFRKHLKQPVKSPNFFLADDTIAILSLEDYTNFVLPYHRKIFDELTDGSGKNKAHFCGDATRFFPLIAKEFNVDYFDTGFPVNHGKLVQELGPDVTVGGGLHVDLLLAGRKEEIEQETKRILLDVKEHSRSFIIKEANNLAPKTPPENIRVMYEAVKRYGVFDS